MLSNLSLDQRSLDQQSLDLSPITFQFTGSPCLFTISPVIKGNQPRNYQSVNYRDAAEQIQLLIEAHWMPSQDAAIIQMTTEQFVTNINNKSHSSLRVATVCKVDI